MKKLEVLLKGTSYVPNSVKMRYILLGNTFPPALIHREVVITPIGKDAALKLLSKGFESFWGHGNTIGAAKELLGVDVTPRQERPAIIADEETDYYPSLYGRIYREVLVISPNYEAGFRPAKGEEVPPENITGWKFLLWEWR